MLRNEVEKLTGLTRKAIEYYEKQGLIKPNRYDNSYRYFDNTDVKTLQNIALYRLLGLSINEIKECIDNNFNIPQSIILKRELESQLCKNKAVILKKLAANNVVETDIQSLQIKETIYQRLENIFPGYFGICFFYAYKPYLNTTLSEEGKVAFDKYVSYLDSLPSIDFSDKEKKYLDNISIDTQMIDEINISKETAVNNIEEWLQQNDEFIKQYYNYKQSEEYQVSIIKQIQDKIKKYMQVNKYYEIAIPLIRQFSPSYDAYYKKLISAGEKYNEIYNNQ